MALHKVVKRGESILINGIRIDFCKIGDNAVSLAITADKEIPIFHVTNEESIRQEPKQNLKKGVDHGNYRSRTQ